MLLTIHDNGKGFSFEKYVSQKQKAGIGLFSMKERAESLHGTFHIESNVKKGTVIKVTIPRRIVEE